MGFFVFNLLWLFDWWEMVLLLVFYYSAINSLNQSGFPRRCCACPSTRAVLFPFFSVGAAGHRLQNLSFTNTLLELLRQLSCLEACMLSDSFMTTSCKSGLVVQTTLLSGGLKCVTPSYLTVIFFPTTIEYQHKTWLCCSWTWNTCQNDVWAEAHAKVALLCSKGKYGSGCPLCL